MLKQHRDNNLNRKGKNQTFSSGSKAFNFMIGVLLKESNKRYEI